MKKFFHLSYITLLASLVFLGACNRDKVEPTINGVDIFEYDLVQISDQSPKMAVTVKASDNKTISEVEVKAMQEGKTAIISQARLTGVTASSLNRVRLDLAFPTNDIAPSGVYTIQYTVKDAKGNASTTSYKVNVLNVRQPAASTCDFSAVPALPQGKNTWVMVTAPASTGNDDVYIVGDFMTDNGAGGNWDPGNASFKMTRIPNTNCYYIALSLSANKQLKFTRGGWGSVMKNGAGGDFSGDGFNNDGNIIYGSTAFPATDKFKFTVPTWSDRYVAPSVIPSEAIKPGMTTVVIDVNTTDDSMPFYLVKKGTTSLNGAGKMFRVVGTKKMAVAVAKEAGAEYIVVRETLEKVGITNYGFDVITTIDAVKNPVENSVAGFKTEFSPETPPTQLYVTGSGVPSSWTENPPSNQAFTSLGNGKFELASIALNANEMIKFLSQTGSWNPQFSLGTAAADKLSGTFIKADATPIPTPATAGNYKIEVNFQTLTYKLTKL